MATTPAPTPCRPRRRAPNRPPARRSPYSTAQALAPRRWTPATIPSAPCCSSPDHTTVLLEQGNVDSVNHAEAVLAREAARALPPARALALHPGDDGRALPMCAGTQYSANIGRVVFGIEERGAALSSPTTIPRTRRSTCPAAHVFARGQKDVKVIGPAAGAAEAITALHRRYWRSMLSGRGTSAALRRLVQQAAGLVAAHAGSGSRTRSSTPKAAPSSICRCSHGRQPTRSSRCSAARANVSDNYVGQSALSCATRDPRLRSYDSIAPSSIAQEQDLPRPELLDRFVKYPEATVLAPCILSCVRQDVASDVGCSRCSVFTARPSFELRQRNRSDGNDASRAVIS